MNDSNLNDAVVPLEYDVKKAIKLLSSSGDVELFLEVMNFSRRLKSWYKPDVAVAAFLGTRVSPDVELFNKLFFSRGEDRFVAWIPNALDVEHFIDDLLAVHVAGSRRRLTEQDWILVKETLTRRFNIEETVKENFNKSVGVIKPFEDEDAVYGWHVFKKEQEAPDETVAFLSLRQLELRVKKIILEIAGYLQLKPRNENGYS